MKTLLKNLDSLISAKNFDEAEEIILSEYARFAYEIVQAGVHRSKSYLLKHNSSVFVAECLNYYRLAISKIKNLDLVKEKFPGIFWKKIEDTDEIFLSYLKPKDA